MNAYVYISYACCQQNIVTKTMDTNANNVWITYIITFFLLSFFWVASILLWKFGITKLWALLVEGGQDGGGGGGGCGDCDISPVGYYNRTIVIWDVDAIWTVV